MPDVFVNAVMGVKLRNAGPRISLGWPLANF